MPNTRFNISTYYPDLIIHLVKRDFSLRYKGSTIGIFWSLLLPLSQLLVLVFLFGKVIPLKIDAYPAFVFSALLPWIWFSTCLNSSASLFLGNRDLLKKPSFPPFILIIVNTLSNLLSYLLFLPILIFILFLYSRHITPNLLFLPFLLLIQCILIVGLSMIIATMNVFYRDIQHIVGLGVVLLFYLTPVFYRAQSISESYKFVYTLNPVAVMIESYREIFFYGSPPMWSSLIIAMINSVVILIIGYFIYRRRLHHIYDLI